MRLSYQLLMNLASLGDVDALNVMEEWDNIVHSYSKLGVECYFQLARSTEEELEDVGVFFLHSYEPRIRPLKSP